MRTAVIDLGTNTCNLLIAEHAKGQHRILHQSKQLVKLGDGRIKHNEISYEATRRTLSSFRKHKEIISDFEVDSVRVVATSAVRTAENRIAFLETLGEESGWLVKIISGECEAGLIFKGVLMALQNLRETTIILDIGGGSNELILAHKKDVLWKESRPTGMARIINNYQLSDPIKPEEIETLQQFFAREHINAIRNCKEKEVKQLVGCSGAFDTIADMIDQVESGSKVRVTQEITLDGFYKVYEMLIHSTRDERLTMKGVDQVRVDLIVPAVILIEKLISAIGIKKIVQTDYALREGVLFEIME